MNRTDLAITKSFDVVPILPSLNFTETRDFYVTHLGFEEVGADCDDYLVIRKGVMELHFWLSDDPFQCQNSSVFFRSNAVSEIYTALRDRGVEAVRPLDQMHEVRFHVRDPHGNLLMFAGSTPAGEGGAPAGKVCH
jgi:catechol 2,3-dioxygenase-like lactoylglutathione lyase family enzyme